MAACLSARLMPVSWKCRARRERPRGVRGSVTRWRPRRDIAPRCEKKNPATGQSPVRGIGGNGDSGARAASSSPAAQAYTMIVGVDRSSASAAMKSVSFTRGHECSQCAIRARSDFVVRCKIDASTVSEVTPGTCQLAAASVPSLRAGSRRAAMIRAAIASRKVRSGISDPENGSGMSNPSSFRRGIRWT